MDSGKIIMEYKGIRDALLFTNKRLVIKDSKVMRGKKVAIISIPWKSILALSIENARTFDLDAELKIYGSGFRLCELKFAKSVNPKEINTLLAIKYLSN